MMRQSNRHSNFSHVDLGTVQAWYSYNTMIAFQFDGEARIVSRNYWTNTTAKHLTCVDGGSKKAKARRVTKDEFARLWNGGKGIQPEPKIVPVRKGSRDLIRKGA